MWTDELRSLVMKLHREGLSPPEIRERIGIAGITRAAISGVIHRMQGGKNVPSAGASLGWNTSNGTGRWLRSQKRMACK